MMGAQPLRDEFYAMSHFVNPMKQHQAARSHPKDQLANIFLSHSLFFRGQN
jgi:hypothetical protein